MPLRLTGERAGRRQVEQRRGGAELAPLGTRVPLVAAGACGSGGLHRTSRARKTTLMQGRPSGIWRGQIFSGAGTKLHASTALGMTHTAAAGTPHRAHMLSRAARDTAMRP
eukprot:scaffold2846_cov125-Isochrysis_galbana.AAC.8